MSLAPKGRAIFSTAEYTLDFNPVAEKSLKWFSGSISVLISDISALNL